jgi:hypothetical protein
MVHALPSRPAHTLAAVVADRVHANELCSPGAIEDFAKAGVVGLGLGVAVRSYKPSTHGSREVR